MKKILIAGEGGQGVQSIAEILARAGNDEGKSVTYIPNFGVEQRGGVSIAFVQIDNKPIGYPKFDEADILVAMCNRAFEPIKRFIGEKTQFIFDNSFIDDEQIEPLRGIVKSYLALPAKDLALKQGSLKISNIIFLGALVNEISEIHQEKILELIEKQFKSHPEFKEQNYNAFSIGLNYAKDRSNQELKGLTKKEIQREFSDDKKTWERFSEYCKGCGLCLFKCPVKAISFSEDLNFLGTRLPKVDIAKCTACQSCQKICPDGAIKVSKKE